MKKLAISGTAGVAIVLGGVLVAQTAGATAVVPTTNMVVQQSAEAQVAAATAAEEARLAAEEAARIAAEQARIAEEQARQAELAASRYGIGPSAYTGSYYDARFESTRKCILRKESGGDYGIVSSGGTYRGAYQFSAPTANATARKMGRADLVGVPVNTWTRAEQDQAFYTLWNHGAGRGNWPTANGC